MPRPVFSTEEAASLVKDHFGLEAASVSQLASYDDQNFRIDTAAQGTFVLKIAAAEAECRGFCDEAATKGMMEMENQAMQLMASAGVSVPSLVPTAAGGELVMLDQLGAGSAEPGSAATRCCAGCCRLPWQYIHVWGCGARHVLRPGDQFPARGAPGRGRTAALPPPASGCLPRAHGPRFGGFSPPLC